jgi:hypothetical protein
LAHNQRYPDALANDDLAWIDFGFSRAVSPHDARRQSRTARRLVRGLFRDRVPGIILGDEVGMGKTYETFGVIAALFRHRPSARVIILTHSTHMADLWRERWKTFCEKAARAHASALPRAAAMNGSHDFGERGLVIGSYETMKRVSGEQLGTMLERCLAGRGIWETTRRNLRRAIVGTGRPASAGLEGLREPSQAALDQIWKLYEGHGQWKSVGGVQQRLRQLVFRSARTKRTVDLLVVDEAHKLASAQRQMFFQEVVSGRARSALYLTATPFALTVDDLVARIRDMFTATGANLARLTTLDACLRKFQDTVERGERLEPKFRASIETELGHYLVRSTWPAEFPGSNRRRRVPRLLRATGPQALSAPHALAILALETAFVRLEEQGGRAHRAVHRETLCSSHAAIRKWGNGGAGAPDLPPFLKRIPAILPKGESPKFDRAVEYLIGCAKARQKVVVFCKRMATIRALADRIRNATQEHVIADRATWARIQRRIHRQAYTRLTADQWSRLRLAAHLGFRVEAGKEAQALRGIRARLAGSGEPDTGGDRQRLWETTWGPRRRIEWVAELTGETRHADDKRRSFEAVTFAFNLPGPPYVLLCTSVAREGIDLHLWCRRILQYDLEWNPAAMEQQVGRIDRMGSLSWRSRKPIEVSYAWQPNTYEERIAHKVEHRLQMMRILLGAGAWLSESPEAQETIDQLEEYRLDFRP